MESTFNLSPDTVIGLFPDDRKKDLMSDMDFYIVMATELGFSSVEGKDRVTRSGDVIKDPVTLTPLPPKQVIAEYFKNRGWVADNKLTDGISRMSDFRKKWTEENPGKDPNGPEFQTAVATHSGTVKEFNWYE